MAISFNPLWLITEDCKVGLFLLFFSFLLIGRAYVSLIGYWKKVGNADVNQMGRSNYINGLFELNLANNTSRWWMKWKLVKFSLIVGYGTNDPAPLFFQGPYPSKLYGISWGPTHRGPVGPCVDSGLTVTDAKGFKILSDVSYQQLVLGLWAGWGGVRYYKWYQSARSRVRVTKGDSFFACGGAGGGAPLHQGGVS